MQAATVEQAKQLGLLEEEFHHICSILGREPNFTELSVFSVMWSEHCSYKNSIVWLKTLPREGSKMLAEAGEENAGLVDIGGGLACCFKIESHNHPSAIEPYQGAATGVGGINRDIFSMGARPIAQLNSLRFGNLKTDRTKWLMKGVVKGIGDYGNAFGIPTVGGEVYFDDCYEQNNLVNAMSVGIVPVGKSISAAAGPPGNPVYIFGSATGKDGIHGAAFASKDMSEDSIQDLPSVQVGDPFWEKLILEATMELIETGAVVGMQDMGAAGITCSTSEMSAKSGVGMDVWLDKVPMRQADMKGWELLLSESQERMLVVVEKGKEHLAEEVFKKWEITYAHIGQVTDTGHVRYYMNGTLEGDIPAESLVLGGGAPVYKREWTIPAYFAEIENFNIDSVADISPEEAKLAAMQLCAEPNIASKRWVYEQYDSMVGTVNQSTNKPSDAAVVMVKGTNKSLALTVDCNSRYIFADPDKGTQIAVAEASRNIRVTGGVPTGVTNCLNFGNPYNKEVYYQFKHAIDGMGKACRKFDTPVTGGNVSFYNQSTNGNAVYPTPTIGMVGIIEKPEHRMTLDFKQSGDLIYLVGEAKNDLGSSQYLAKLKGVEYSPCPQFDLDEEHSVQMAVYNAITAGLLNSAHDISEGGLFIACLESAMAGKTGFDICTLTGIRNDAWLFGESQSRVVVSISQSNKLAFETAMQQAGVKTLHIGTVTGSGVAVNGQSWGEVQDFAKPYNSVIAEAIG
ncbi:MAG: phosphoribosylformylglycinamidine synthase subunit PurL [Sphingomonadales bacterium]|nr:phosphoribosylformylglycinamidine synthase subunit PurL [Sphingomonadales bacterium]